jgi:hypothetical protein
MNQNNLDDVNIFFSLASLALLPGRYLKLCVIRKLAPKICMWIG